MWYPGYKCIFLGVLMETIRYIDRVTKQEEEEQVYGVKFLRLLYGKRSFFRFLLPLFARLSFFSGLFGWIQKRAFTKKKIRPFVEAYRIDAGEFLDSVDSFQSFNDFFIRRLKFESRPQAPEQDVATLPADARYLAYANMQAADGFVVKGKKFSLEILLQDPYLVGRYREGSLLIARLCPTDYHRFHFPCTGTPGPVKLINGPLYSVNPIALRRNIEILAENKRMVTEVKTRNFGTLLYIEVGATNVGSIVQTYQPGVMYAKGDEKGFFSFGGSTLILLFEPGRIAFDQDLLDVSKRCIEMRGLVGQSLGRALSPI